MFENTKHHSRHITVACSLAWAVSACQPPAPSVAPEPARSIEAAESTTPTDAPLAAAPADATGATSAPPAAVDKPSATLSQEESISLLVNSRFQSITPDEAKQRLTRAGEVRETRDPAANDVVLKAAARSLNFEVNYVRDSVGAWGFTGASMSARVSDERDATSVFQRYDSILRERFGKPTWVSKDEPPPSSRGWDLEHGALSLRLSQRETPEGLIILLEYSEPDGEAE